MYTNTTTDCVNAINTHFHTTSQPWKRIRKFSPKGTDVTIREFTSSGLRVSVISNDRDGEHIVRSGSVLPDEASLKKILAFCNTIKHCGDYCNVYYNASEQKIWVCMGDGDGEDPATDIDDIITGLKQFVPHVDVEAEADPNRDTYVPLGYQLGKVISW